METWAGIAILLVTLVAGAISWAMIVAMAAGRFEADTADARRRARRRARVVVVTFLVTVPLAATLWSIGSPTDAWWMLPAAVVLVAAGVVALRRIRAADRA